VVAFAGKISNTQAEKLAGEYFGELGGAKEGDFPAFEKFGDKRVFLRKKKTEQAHLVLGVPGVPHMHEDHYTHKLLSIILGGNMSSRMFLNIREAKGMCYYIDTETDSYLDAGALSTRAGVDQSRLKEAVKLIRHEYDVMAADGVTDEEMTRAKAYLKGRITLSLEDSEELAHFSGKQKLLYPNVLSLEDYFQKVDSITKADVDGLAARLLTPEELRLVVIGQGVEEAELEELLS
jgi:predicted Zn-dependent peptidase